MHDISLCLFAVFHSSALHAAKYTGNKRAVHYSNHWNVESFEIRLKYTEAAKLIEI